MGTQSAALLWHAWAQSQAKRLFLWLFIQKFWSWGQVEQCETSNYPAVVLSLGSKFFVPRLQLQDWEMQGVYRSRRRFQRVQYHEQFYTWVLLPRAQNDKPWWYTPPDDRRHDWRGSHTDHCTGELFATRVNTSEYDRRQGFGHFLRWVYQICTCLYSETRAGTAWRAKDRSEPLQRNFTEACQASRNLETE